MHLMFVHFSHKCQTRSSVLCGALHPFRVVHLLRLRECMPGREGGWTNWPIFCHLREGFDSRLFLAPANISESCATAAKRRRKGHLTAAQRLRKGRSHEAGSRKPRKATGCTTWWQARHVDDAVCTRDVHALQHNHTHTTVSSGSHAGTGQQLGVALMASPLTIVELRHRVGGHRVVAVRADRRGEPLEVVWRAAVVGNVCDLLYMHRQHND